MAMAMHPLYWPAIAATVIIAGATVAASRDREIKEPTGGSLAQRSPNREAYVAWTCVDTATGWRIESGWEYREDALDRRKAMIDAEGWDTSRVKVMQRAGLRRLGLDPARREDWLSY